jgi:SAM-dependent methyltransferase
LIVLDKLITNRREAFWNPEAHARDQWVREQAARLPAGSLVLDAGAGASKYRPFFAHCDYQTQDFCQYEGPLVKYLQPVDHVCEITRIPLPDGALDCILCTEVLEHVPDPMAVLAEFSRLLKRDGLLLLTAPLLSHLHMEPYHYYGGFTHYWYRHWLPKHGLRVETILPVGGPGRSCATFGIAFYTAWGQAERREGAARRLLSKGFRAGAKVIFHYLWPWLLPKWDGWLGNQNICSGYLVAARKQAGHEGSGSEG